MEAVTGDTYKQFVSLEDFHYKYKSFYVILWQLWF